MNTPAREMSTPTPTFYPNKQKHAGLGSAWDLHIDRSEGKHY